MCRKSTSIIVFLCLLVVSNGVALATSTDRGNYPWDNQLDWKTGNADANWFNTNNWDQRGDDPPPPGTYARAVLLPNQPGPRIEADACCSMLDLNPWDTSSWGDQDCNVTILSGDVNCGAAIQLDAWFDNDYRISGSAILNVYGGTVRTPNPATGVLDGLRVGGGQSNYAYARGIVNQYGGTISVNRLALYHGYVNLYGGTLEVLTDSNLIFQQIRDNRIVIDGGKLQIQGDITGTLSTLITAGRIISKRGTLGAPTFAGGVTTLTSDVNLATSWEPVPANNATGVRYATSGVRLSWKPGDWVGYKNADDGHYVFLGASQSDVTNAPVGTAGTAEAVYRGRVEQSNLEDPNRDPNDPNITIAAGTFAENTPYYWRVDEVNSADPCVVKGNVWKFTTISSKASNPSPAHNGTGLKMPLELSWTAGDWSPTTHWVYFGTALTQVTLAGTSSGKPVYRGTVNSPVYPLSKLVLETPGYTLAPNTTYYWRVDEIDSLGRIPGQTGYLGKGPIWSFNTGSSITIDDYQSYETSDDMNAVWLKEQKVCDSGTRGPTGYGTLITVGSTEGDAKYMRFTYTKTSDSTQRKFSELDRAYNGTIAQFGGGNPSVLTSPPKLFQLSFLGTATNGVHPTYDRMYVAVEDSSSQISITLNPDPNAQQIADDWTDWFLTYDELKANNTAVDLNNIRDLYLGFGSRCTITASGGGDGNVMFDNITLVASTCNPDHGPVADFDGNCTVNIQDLDILASDWLSREMDYNWIESMDEPEAPILWYKFNETSNTNVNDSGTGDANVAEYMGTVNNYSLTLTWDADGGRDGNGCIYLPPGQSSYISVPVASLYFVDANAPAYYTNGISFSAWIKADVTVPNMRTSWNGLLGTWTTSELLEVHCPSPFPPTDTIGPRTNFIKKSNGSAALESPTLTAGDYGNKWNNWVFVKDSTEMRIYHNGVLVGDVNTLDDADVAGPLFLMPVTEFRIGTRGTNWGMWNGRIDDFTMYDYALSEAEVQWIATDGTGLLNVPLVSPANIKTDMTYDSKQIVNMSDLALMVDEWMQTILWP